MTEARAHLSDLVSQVAYGGEPVVLTRHGKALVALVPAALLDEAAATAGNAESREAPLVLDVTTLGRGGHEQYTLVAHHRGTDEPPR